MVDQEIIRRLDKIEKAIERIERKLSMLMQEKKKQTWVKAPIITRLTGWGGEAMRRAREYGYVQYKEDKKTGFWYLLESLHPVHLKQKQDE